MIPWKVLTTVADARLQIAPTRRYFALPASVPPPAPLLHLLRPVISADRLTQRPEYAYDPVSRVAPDARAFVFARGAA